MHCPVPLDPWMTTGDEKGRPKAAHSKGFGHPVSRTSLHNHTPGVNPSPGLDVNLPTYHRPPAGAIIAGALDALAPAPDLAGTAAFWRAMPKASPGDALDAALRCVTAGRPVYPVRMVRTAGGGTRKQPAVRDYWTTAAVPADHGPGRRPARCSTLDPNTCRRWWGPRGRFAGCAVGMVLAPDALVLDADDADAAAWLADAVIDAADTWIIHGGRGARAVYRRPAWVEGVRPGWRGVQVHQAAAGGCDVVGGVLVVWAPGRSWTGGPELVADVSPAIDRALRAVLDPPRRAPSGPAVLPGADRAARYAEAAIANARAHVAALAPGTRQAELNKAAYGLGEALSRADRPDLAEHAADALATAAPWADTRRERATIRRALTAGMAAAGPGLPDRPGWTPRTAPPPATGPDADAIRAAAAAALGTLRADVAMLRQDDGRPLHPKTRATVFLLAAYLLTEFERTGRAELARALATVGLAIDRGPASVGRAARQLPALGIDVELGSAADGRATSWVFSRVTKCGRRPPAAVPDANGGGGLNARFVVRENPPPSSRDVLDAAGSDLCRGLRRRPCRPSVVPDVGDDGHRRPAPPALSSMGAYAGDVVAVLRAAPRPLAADDVAAALGCSPATARRGLAVAAARGAAVASVERSGGRGRPRTVYTMAEHVTEAPEAVVELGARARANAEAGIAAARDRLRRARALALRGVAPVAVLLARLKSRDRAERSIARGGDVGRPEYGRDAGARALAASAAWVLDGYRQAGATIEAAVVPDPPAWAVEAVPLW